MEESVAGIFKTLIKIPIIIMISYLFFNLFLFAFVYFKALGISYAIEQVAIENNYLPPNELALLNNLVRTLDDIPSVNGSVITGDYANRRQYGKPVTVGVQCSVRFVWPLSPREQTSGNRGFDGFDGSSGALAAHTSSYKSQQEMAAARSAKGSTFTFKIEYTVPGLKYYPDLTY